MKLSELHEQISFGKSAAQQPPAPARSAVIIEGNPAYAGPQMSKFYDDIQKYLEAKGLNVSRDPGEPHTVPNGGDYWIGHSRGVDRLRFAPEGVRTLALDDYEPEEIRKRNEEHWQRIFKERGVNQIADVPLEHRPPSYPEHFMFNDDQRAVIDEMTQPIKTAADFSTGLGVSIGVNANRPLWQSSLINQALSPSWSPDKSVLQNIGSNLGQAYDRGRQAVTEFNNLQDIKTVMQPGYGMQRVQDLLHHGDPLQDPVDRALFRNYF